ncbi:MAG TPA: M28 family peptidase [Candidatus Limnocylindrales bacterium]|nr:M28 family peptidase [Candidatus Limnocylindrales bacterium]
MRRQMTGCFAAAVFAGTVFFAFSGNGVAADGKGTPKKGPAVPAYGNSDAITQDELKVYDYFLASDQLEGRNFPSRGYDTAALYVASHLAEWGLKPGGSTEKTMGPLQPYLMPIEMVSRAIVPDESKVSVTAPGGGGGRGFGGGGGGRQGGGRANNEPRTTAFEYGKDWTAGAGGGRGASPEAFDFSGNLVFAGNGYLLNKTNVNPYQGIDVKGKIIVVAGLPAELAALQNAGGRGRGAGGGGRGAAQNPLGENCTDYLTPEEYAAKNGALGVITIANFQQAAALANPNAGGFGGGGGRGGANLNGPNFQVVKFKQAAACPAAPSITAGMELTNALFQGEKLSGAQVFYATDSKTKVDSFELEAAKKVSLKLAVKGTPGHGENVVGILEGSDPVLKNEYVVMSAHLDHIGLSAPLPDGHNVNNGADDDGSGSTGLLAIAHAFAEGAAKGIRPKRSIIFLWNGGEEKGLLGSQYFAEFPPVDLTKVVADLNMDMIGRSQNPASVDNNKQHVLVKSGECLLIGPNISSDELGSVIDKVNGGYQKLAMNHFYDATAPDATHDNLGPEPNGQRIFYRSDHYNFAKVGVPIAFFTTGLHVDYHRPTDTPDKIDYVIMQQIAKTVAATGWELANSPTRPKLNAKLPEQLTKDMKTVQEQGWGKMTPVLPPLPGMPY